MVVKILVEVNGLLLAFYPLSDRYESACCEQRSQHLQFHLSQLGTVDFIHCW